MNVSCGTSRPVFRTIVPVQKSLPWGRHVDVLCVVVKENVSINNEVYTHIEKEYMCHEQ